MTDAFERVFGKKMRVMVVMAHPDDAELYAGGTIARLVGAGKRVRVIKATYGNKGSRQEKVSEKELREIREREDRAAMRTLGIKEEDNIYLGIGDGEVTDNPEVIGKLAFQIRVFQPELVITHNPEDVVIKFDEKNSWINHRDHRNTGLAVMDGSYPFARDVLFYPEHFNDPAAESHIVTEFLLVDYYGHPDCVGIEMGQYVETRVRAHAQHSSQYSLKDAQDSADFFAPQSNGKRFERFRYVVVD